MSLYLVNPHSVYFRVDCEVNLSLKEECQIFDTKEEMYQFVCEQGGFELDEVEGNEFVIKFVDGVYREVDARGFCSPVDFEWAEVETIEEFILQYEM